jgi:hypothetical protein
MHFLPGSSRSVKRKVPDERTAGMTHGGVTHFSDPWAEIHAFCDVGCIGDTSAKIP